MVHRLGRASIVRHVRLGGRGTTTAAEIEKTGASLYWGIVKAEDCKKLKRYGLGFDVDERGCQKSGSKLKAYPLVDVVFDDTILFLGFGHNHYCKRSQDLSMISALADAE